MSKKMNRSSSAFGQKLRDLRKQRKITMKQLAERVGVSESYISRLETGERHPDKALILRMAPLLFPEGNAAETDQLLIAADYTPIKLDQFTGSDDVIDHFRQVLTQDPENFRAFNALMISLIKQGNYELAQKQLQQGLERYDDSIHLQVLMGALELAQSRFETALAYQREALLAYDRLSPAQASRLYLQRTDLLLNQAVIAFLQGYAVIGDYLEAPQPELYTAAKGHLQMALQALEEALLAAPEDIYVLDEYARVHFNLAYLEASAGHAASYAATIVAFERVVHSEEKHLLNYSDLIESSLFLVHAYAKQGSFVEAERHIHIVECCLPNFWLVHYIKACLYALKYVQQPEPRALERAFRSLERALALPDAHNRSRSEAPHDPDLVTLRLHDPVRFSNLLKLEATA